MVQIRSPPRNWSTQIPIAQKTVICQTRRSRRIDTPGLSQRSSIQFATVDIRSRVRSAALLMANEVEWAFINKPANEKGRGKKGGGRRIKCPHNRGGNRPCDIGQWTRQWPVKDKRQKSGSRAEALREPPCAFVSVSWMFWMCLSHPG